MDDMVVVQVRLQGGGTVITVAGEVDIATAPRLGHHLAALAGSGRPVIADLDQVSFIDAAGLRVLAARDLAGPSWLAAASDDPDIAAFTALQATPAPPSPAGLDEIISRVLWARFPPPGTRRDGGPSPAGTPAR